MRTAVTALALAASVGTLAACGSSSSSKSGTDAGVTVHLGFLPNITHSTALVGVQQGIFQKDLGSNKLQTAGFNAGPAAVTALFSGALDAAYVGPNSAINAWAKSHGSAIKIISGAASGGASLVVQPGITSAAGLKGKKVATPQLGNTQDVALRSWLKSQGLATTTSGGGDVTVLPEDNSVTVQAFAQGKIAGAWLPEPYASQLVVQDNGVRLVDEKSLWPAGRFVTTELVVRTAFAEAHPGLVKKLVQGSVDSNAYINANPAAAQADANTELGALSGKPLKPAVLAAAFGELTFTNDPIAASLATDAQHAEQVGLLTTVNLTGIYDLSTLNSILKASGQPAVNAS